MDANTFPWGTASRYNDFAAYVKRTFGQRAQKVSVNAGFTCPNRDGTKGTGGCAFCNNSTFNPDYCDASLSVTQQIDTGIEFFSKYKANIFLAYFQAYSNTYGDTQRIISLYDEALRHPAIGGLVIGTRPDCIAPDLLSYLADIARHKYVAIELGAESCSDNTLRRINRGHTWADTVAAAHSIADAGIPVGLHMIMGLPGESRQMMIDEAATISELPVTFLKLHQLQIVRGSALADQYASDPNIVTPWQCDDYIDFCIDFAERLRPSIVIERFVSQAPRSMVVAPFWNIKNYEFAHKIERRFAERNTWQGRLYNK